MIEEIQALLVEIWAEIKKIFVKIINFFNNILGWFKDLSRLKILKEKNNKVAVSIKENMTNGDYNVINCLFDEETNKIDDAEVIQSKNIDQKTKDSFGNQDMIILN